MKNILISLSVLLLLVGLGSCEQQFSVESPEIINFEYDTETAYPGTPTYFDVEVIGDFTVIWSGDVYSDYDAHLANPTVENTATNFDPDYDKLTGTSTARVGIKYSKVGTFKAVLVASNIGYQGEEVETVSQEITVNVLPYTDTEIAVFVIRESAGDAVISGDTISVLMPYNFDLTALAPILSISDSATVSPASTEVVDFTNMVIYTVTAHDGVTTKEWKVFVTNEDPMTDTDITGFSVPGQRGDAIIDANNHTVGVNMPPDDALTALVPDISLSDAASVNPESGAAADFTNPVVFTVMAQDGVTTQDWTVTVTNMPASTETDITGFVIPEATGDAIINSTYHTVAVAVPAGTNVTALVPGITLSDYATVDPASNAAADFTNPVTYTVTAEDGTSTQDWTVTVTVLE